MNTQNGNALFLILIAVALFAALSYAVTNSGRGGGGVDKEQAEITTALILQNLNTVNVGLQRFLIIGGYDIENIDIFESGQTMTGDVDSCTVDSCNLLHPDGGRVPTPLLPAEAISASGAACPYISGNKIRPYFLISSIEGVGTTASDIAILYCGVDIEICRTINDRMNVKNYGDSALQFNIGSASSNQYQAFTGTQTSPMADTVDNYLGTAQDSRLNGHHTFCNEVEGSIGAQLVHVIYAR